MGKVFHTEFVDKGILKIVFDLPDSRANIFNRAVLEELPALIDELEVNGEIRLAYLVSGKENIFIAGADVHEIFKITTVDDAYEKSRLGQNLIDR